MTRSSRPAAGAGRRPERVGGRIAEILSQALLRDLADPRLTGATITNVRVTPDLRVARVYFTLLDDQQDRKAALAGFRSAAAFLRREVGREGGLRYTPELEFEYDIQLETARRVTTLLRSLPRETESDEPTASAEAGDQEVDANSPPTADSPEAPRETPNLEPKK
jgi:ribosome-binding factor A